MTRGRCILVSHINIVLCEHKQQKEAKTNNLLLHGHGVSEVNGQLSDIDEGVLVSDLRVQGVHLCQSSLHEVDHGQHVGRRELAVLYIRNVHLLQRGRR